MKQNLNRTRKDETGKIYGQWKVIGLSEKESKSQTIYWECICSCGQVRDVIGTSLRDGSSTSCGCTKTSPVPAPESIYRKYYRSYKYGSIRKTNTYDFSLTFEEYKELIMEPCHYCGREPYDTKYLYNRKRKRNINLDVSVKINGIDRVDNTKGYHIENCVPCCKMCNRMKLDYTEDDFLKQVALIYERKILNEKISHD